ncbi:hypothetical protein [Hymenobacter jeollabukensis]|uniref:Uncharacterized protein n=1 Tax=Hymenobacter jeollabukensis TaxID=2025313 RepID=A0A5R8WTC6_9BACT|nr:hypothetical protein FDY95_08670 [Hymenobacter jeollabukensis]
MQVDTLLGRFLQVREVDQAPRLFYQPTPGSSVWTEVQLALPEWDDNSWWRNGNGTVVLDTLNLDGRGAPEVLATVETYHMGSGSGSRWVYQAVLDVSAKPVLLLRGLTEIEEETHGPGAEGTPADELVVSCERKMALRNHEVVVGATYTVGKPDSVTCAILTKLPAGRYRYQHGNIVRVGN